MKGEVDEAAVKALAEFQRTQYACNVLKANKHPELKVKLGLQGDFKKHLEAAESYLLDTAFSLSAAQSFESRGLLGKWRSGKLKEWVAAVDAAAARKISGQVKPGEEVVADVSDKVEGD